MKVEEEKKKKSQIERDERDAKFKKIE